MTRNLGLIGLVGLATWAIAAPPAEACIPVAQIAWLFGGPVMWASVYGMALAVAVKCVSFWRHEQRLPGWMRVATMVVANVLSTVFAIVFAFWYTSGGLMTLVFNLPLLFMLPLAWRASRSWALMAGWGRGAAFALGVVGLLALQLAALNLFGVIYAYRGDESLWHYWAFKLPCVTAGAASALLVTIAVEEAVISWLGRRHGDSFLPTVGRANMVAFLIVAAFGAALVLPHRVIDRDYLHRPAPAPQARAELRP